ncbi:putative cytokinetic ring protein SteA [Paenibacillus piri]|uniref:Thiamine pyrophosphokinase n=1 Tax=Paenibacillus piri TaxID=2547395 RepID=A0A4V2ZU19_9BACL|nr:putative cytokinetic ring protein SteA [Paenibacillus piri]TDF99254.1 thiamine pyrophosphokinase [Paenibacillus piri]
MPVPQFVEAGQAWCTDSGAERQKKAKCSSMAVSKNKERSAQHTVAEGRVQADRVTKRLIRRILPGSIAVIDHDDMDELAAEGLMQAGVRAVINAGRTMTGKIPGRGPLLLLEYGIPIVEIDPVWFPSLQHAKELRITDDRIIADEGLVIPCRAFTAQSWLELHQLAKHSLHEQLKAFIANTLTFAQAEQDAILQPLRCDKMKTVIEGRHVLIVVRGNAYKQDLAALESYIRRCRPVLVGVDGGADALLEFGYTPDLIVGDMDSVSDTALHCGAELIVHAYHNGSAPGLDRLRSLGLKAIVLAACGTSEDMALLLAHDHQCKQIVTVGLHTHMYDFLEKGRQGMGSTQLVLMKVGDKLIDAKGFAKLAGVPSSSVPNVQAEAGNRGFDWSALGGRLIGRVGRALRTLANMH